MTWLPVLPTLSLALCKFRICKVISEKNDTFMDRSLPSKSTKFGAKIFRSYWVITFLVLGHFFKPHPVVAEFGDCRRIRRQIVAEIGHYSLQCGQGLTVQIFFSSRKQRHHFGFGSTTCIRCLSLYLCDHCDVYFLLLYHLYPVVMLICWWLSTLRLLLQLLLMDQLYTNSQISVNIGMIHCI